MFVFAASAAGFGTIMAIVSSNPSGTLPPLGLSGARSSAATWCGANLVVTTLMSFGCGWLATKWRRAEQRKSAQPARRTAGSRTEFPFRGPQSPC
jgi:hypothetical protein